MSNITSIRVSKVTKEFLIALKDKLCRENSSEMTMDQFINEIADFYHIIRLSQH